MQTYPLRYTGPRWVLIYGPGSESGPDAYALEELYRKIQAFLPYVVGLYPAAQVTPEIQENHLILIGTLQDNPWLSQVLPQALPHDAGGYCISCAVSPWHPGRRVIGIAGIDDAGVLYGVQDFITRILLATGIPEKPTPERLRQALDGIGDHFICEHPRIASRGIWTWGYVIYDYRRFLDKMASLKLNLLTIWNDIPPLNCRQVIEYAHARGVRVFLGFPWGWGMNLDITQPADRQRIKEMVLAHYQEYYTGLGMDGIYFQTLTEHHHTELGGQPVASIVCEMVNDIAHGLFQLNPGLKIQFGLHATSILERYPELAALDERITIVWEDAGVLPYSYIPAIERPASESAELRLDTFDATVEYSRKLATFRPGAEFAMVPKGWSCLDWPGEFEHHGPFLLGVRDPAFIQGRMHARQPYWERINRLWLKHYRYAVQFYRAMLACKPARMSVAGLVEDGLFEACIQPSVALFAETLWNPERDEDEILQLALMPRDLI
jgi:hypothetical protein